MPKRYEEEINEILHKFDDWPPPPSGRRPQQGPPRRPNPNTTLWQFFDHLGPQQLMAVGLVLIALGVVLRFGYRFGMDVGIGGYTTTAGFVLLLAGYLMAVMRGGSLRGLGRHQQVWRGRVIDLPPAGRGLAYWWWRLRSNLRGR